MNTITKLKCMSRMKLETICVAAIVVTMVVAALLSTTFNVVAALLLMGISAAAYLLLAYRNDNLFDFLGLVFVGFVFPMGLACVRLASYQRPWSIVTWICFIGAVIFFYVGYALRGRLINRMATWEISNHFADKFKCKIALKPKFIYFFAIFTFCLLLSGFFIKWWVADGLPLFKYVDSQTYFNYLSGEIYMADFREKWQLPPLLFLAVKAYHRFSTIFMFQGWLSSCFAFYYVRRHAQRAIEKAVCWIMIACSIAIPVIIVCREILMMTTVALAVAGFFICRKKKLLFVIAMVFVTALTFYISTQARGYSAKDIGEVFEMTEPGPSVSKHPNIQQDKKEHQEESDNQSVEYPGIVVWVYTYFTCGYDNFNHLVENLDIRLNGLMQIRPIFAALQISGLKDVDLVLQQPQYRVSPNITTYTFLSDAFTDFGMLGVFVSLFIWGAVFGCISEFYGRYQSVISLMVYAAIGHHLIFMCFVPWMQHFSYLCSFGLLMLFYPVLYFVRNRGRDTQ